MAVAPTCSVGGVGQDALRRLEPEHLGDHVDRLYRAAWALCGNPHDAEDLVQETYLRVLAKPRWLRHDDDLGYLLRALRNTHVAGYRRRGRRPVEVPLETDRPVGGFDPRLPEAALEVSELFAAISDLPEDARAAIVAVDVAGLGYREAADALRIKEATLTTRLHRARKRLSRELYPQEART